MPNLVDLNVIMKAKRGDEVSIVEILMHYRRFIDYQCTKICGYGNKQERYVDEDCRQFVFLKMLKAIENFDPDYCK
ncbi:MAG: helix-turn-helix domain-containing protein [Ruminiclostridium sp.]|nr:helix-turn-helix domain-containing protein [Ruminiclostridium sp.]